MASVWQAPPGAGEGTMVAIALAISFVARLLYITPMRSANFPPIRVEPKVRAEVEAVLREGESLTQFIEEAVVAAAAWRRVQSEFVTRGEAAIERWKQEGGGHSVDEVMADLQARLDDAKRRAGKRASQ
ncbi:MAG: YlcI/YnfO family protein [Burkholderiaceae bacterium]